MRTPVPGHTRSPTMGAWCRSRPNEKPMISAFHCPCRPDPPPAHVKREDSRPPSLPAIREHLTNPCGSSAAALDQVRSETLFRAYVDRQILYMRKLVARGLLPSRQGVR